MSRTDDYGLASHTRDFPERAHSAPDRANEIGSRMGVSHETAHAEMERFRGVAEYEVRKLFGQKSALREPIEQPAATKPARRSNARPTPTASPEPGSPRNDKAQVTTPSQNTPERPVPDVDAPAVG
jgi:hypothetical protein